MARRNRVIAVLVCLLAAGAPLLAQPTLHDAEPNDTPAQAQRAAGEVRIVGSLAKDDQDGYLWTVADTDAVTRWNLELHGIPGHLTKVEVVRLEWAEDGQGVARKQVLASFGSRDGTRPGRLDQVLFEPGEYLLGVAKSGGEGQYRLDIGKGARVPTARGSQGQATRDTAGRMRGGAAYTAYLETPEAWWRWELAGDDAGRRWALTATVPLGRRAVLALHDAAGRKLADVRADDRGHFALPDLALEPGAYLVQLRREGEEGMVALLEAHTTGARVAGQEEEPNDTLRDANVVDLAQPVTGRMGRAGDTDSFRFTMGEDGAETLHELRLEGEWQGLMRLCLVDDAGQPLQCRDSQEDMALPDLLFEPGEHRVTVSRAQEGGTYRLSLTATGRFEPGREAEPNDTPATATGMSGRTAKGTLAGRDDVDVFRFTVDEEPQLWRLQAIGEGLTLTYHDGSGRRVQEMRPGKGQRRTRLSNLFLLPGSHYAAVSGPRGGDYTLRVLPIGPPDPLMEREPNDDPSRSHRLDFGATRRGLLDEANDRDAYRFHLGAPDHIRITLTPPADGTVAAALDYEGRGLKQSQGVSGDPLVLEGLFPPGDYGLTLSVEKPSDGEYTLRLERLDRFACPVDCEPNDSESFANPLPADRVLTGSIGPWREWDVFALPAAPEPRALVVSGELSGIDFRLKVDGIWPRLEWDRQAGEVRGEVPADTPAYLEVGGKGSYRLQVRLDPEPAPAPPPGELPVDVAVELETDTVAAFRRLGQLVGGRVLLTHRGDRPRRVALDAATSQYGWEVAWQGDPDHGAAPSPPASGATAGSPPSRSPAIDVPAGGSASVGFTLHVPADAWADVPVRVSVRAADATGAAAGWAEATPGRETRPVAPRRAWEVPDALLGGLNVAWSALGAERVGGEDLQNGRVCRGADYLFDELTTIGEGFVCRGNRPDEAIEVTIDLAGDQPVAVAGFALHPQSESTALHRARAYLLSLSLDGREWREVARGELSPLPVQQAIPLAAPVPARFARLRLGHNHRGDHAVQLGEWKVLAAPGTPVPGAPPNLADPALGGHVVWSQPHIDPFWGVHVLTEKAETPTVRLREGERGEWVVGFHHDRAAQIAGIEWVAWQREHAPAFAEVSLAVSVDSPLGPWEPLGSWQVAPTGTTTIALPEPAWARFLKLSAESRGAAAAYPETIRVFERPTDGSYRSILGAWGHRSGDGPYEAARPAAAEETVTVAGNRSRATAHLLPLARTTSGRVRLGGGAAWYGVVVPPGHNTLQVRLAGDPGVRVVARLETVSGKRVPLREIDIAPSQHLFEAVVEPAGEYYLAVEEPPRSVIFSWDTSASVNPYIQLIYSSLAAFAEDVQPGREEVNLLPFGGRLLLADWSGHPYVLRTALNEYPRNDNSSSAERTLAQAAETLAGRAGTRAVVLVTDAATPPYPAVWSALREGRPRIFGLGISVQKAFEQGLMEDWSRVDAGEFHQLTTVGAMERGFDRAVTLLRRPADYTLEVTSRFEEAPGPGTLAVVAKEGEGEPTGPAVELILDASGSMLQRMADGRRRIEVAREVLTRVVTERLPPGTPLALRVFGHRQANACRTDLEVPLAPLDPAAVSRTIAGIQAKNLAKTPIADSLAAVEKDLANAPGQKLVVLVTDGEETCDGKPEEVLAGLRDKGFAVTVNVVGFAIDDPELERTFAGWAAEGGGRYFSARDREGLDAAVAQALEVPFAVYDSGGTRVAEGVVGGAPVELEAGVYRVEVATEPPRSFEEVEVPGEEQVTLEIGGGG